MRVRDLTGCKFGRLYVLKRAPNDKFNNSRWECLCKCGNKTIVAGNALRSGNTKSCGCLHREVMRKIVSKQNKFDLSGECGVGYTSNTNKPFYFDLEDFDKIKNYCWVERSDGYIVANSKLNNNQTIRMHRLVTNNQFLTVDHINCKKYDNRKINLRSSNKQLNNINRGVNSNNKLGIKGIFKKRDGNYIAKIEKGNKIYTKSSGDLEYLIAWRKAKEIELYGEYAYKYGG